MSPLIKNSTKYQNLWNHATFKYQIFHRTFIAELLKLPWTKLSQKIQRISILITMATVRQFEIFCYWFLRLRSIGSFIDPISSISIGWILYTRLLPVIAWREGNIARSAKSIYIAAGLGNKKISFPFSPHHPSYYKRWLSTKGASAISPMQWRTWINALRGGL
jgi:hypothetical protein